MSAISIKTDSYTGCVMEGESDTAQQNYWFKTAESEPQQREGIEPVWRQLKFPVRLHSLNDQINIS